MTTTRQTGGLPVATRAVGLTDVGQERGHNEDTFNVAIPPEQVLLQLGALYLVADGMGGHQAGEVASARACEVIALEYYAPYAGAAEENLAARLLRAMRKANQAVYALSQESAQRKGMGTTTVAALVRGSEIHIANVGDSRAYLFRGGRLEQITEDHSFVQEQIRAGILTKEMARNHPQKNVITRALGHRAEVEVDTFAARLRPGDKVLLCSDGLTGAVREEQIAEIVQRYPIDEAVTRLIALANANGGPDNITALLIEAQVFQPGTPLAEMIPPAPVRPAVDPDPQAVEAASLPPVPPSSKPARRRMLRREFLVLGALAVLLLVAMVVAGVLLFGREDGVLSGRTPTPTADTTREAAPPGSDAPGEQNETLVGQGTPTPKPTSTPRPAQLPAATATLQPTPTQPPLPTVGICLPKAPRLVEPEDEKTFIAWVDDVKFRWEGGMLCDNQQWVITFNGSIYGESTSANELTMKVGVTGGTYQWRVEARKDGQVVRGVMSAPRTIAFSNPPGGGTTPTETPGPPEEPTAPPPTAPSEREDG